MPSSAPIPHKPKRADVSDLAVVRAVARYQAEGGPFPYELLSEELGIPEKVAYRACERAYDRGFIEFGASLRTGWLTEKGKAFLQQPPPGKP